MRRHFMLMLGFMVLVLVGCSGSSAPAPVTSSVTPAAAVPAAPGKPVAPKLSGKLVLTGSSTVSPICAEVGKKFEKLHPDVRIDVQTGGSSRGIADARSGVADIGLCSRALKDDEKDLKAYTIARDGVCVILHKDNPVKELTDAQVVGIYKGQTLNWKDVGGKDAPITVVNKAEGRSTLELFSHYYKLKLPEIKAHVIIGDNEQGVKTVAGNPNTIGYVSIGTAEADVQQGVPIKLLPVSGVAATLENVKNEKFPLSRPLNLVVKAEPQGLSKAFIDYICSKEANPTIKELFFVPVKE